MSPSIIPKILAPIVLVAIGVGVKNHLIDIKAKAEIKAPTEPVTLVGVEEAVPASHQVSVVGTGTVVPARSIVIQPELTGRITKMNGNLVKGGRLIGGTTLIEIDNRDYKLQVSQRASAIGSAKAQLRIERGRKRVAEREWKVLGTGKGASTEGKALALRAPQIAAAKAGVRGAQVALQRARLLAGKTTITVPFNAIVDSESAELQQLVGPSSRLATLIGTDRYWVEVALPVNKLPWITIPGVNTTAERGSDATVRLKVGEDTLVKRDGFVVRLKPSLDPVGRMARVVIAIDNPLGLREDGTTDGMPLFTNAYVSVDIKGKTLNDVVELPRLALREGNTVWLMNAKSRLEMKTVSVLWRLKGKVLVRGIPTGSQVIMTLVPSPIPNMRVAVEAANAPDADKPEEPDETAKATDAEAGQ